MRWSSAREKMMEQAKEDLRILETQHPNRLEPLKQELKSFINDMTFSDHHHDDDDDISCPSSSSCFVSTQESTSKKKDERSWEGSERKLQRVDDHHHKGLEMRRVDLVLERARSCLRKLQQVKSSLG